MHYSNAVKSMLFASINELASNPENYAVHPGKDFSRYRKIGFKDLLLMLLTMEADCIKEELYRYFGRSTNTPSKAAFYKQRKRLKMKLLGIYSFLLTKNAKRICLEKSIPLLHVTDPLWIFSETLMIRIRFLNQMESLQEVLIRFILMLSFLCSTRNLQI